MPEGWVVDRNQTGGRARRRSRSPARKELKTADGQRSCVEVREEGIAPLNRRSLEDRRQSWSKAREALKCGKAQPSAGTRNAGGSAGPPDPSTGYYSPEAGLPCGSACFMGMAWRVRLRSAVRIESSVQDCGDLAAPPPAPRTDQLEVMASRGG